MESTTQENMTQMKKSQIRDEIQRDLLVIALDMDINKKVDCREDTGSMREELYTLCCAIEFGYQLINKIGADNWLSHRYIPRSVYCI